MCDAKRDKTEFELMLEQIKLYENQEIQIFTVINNLEGLLQDLESIEPEWRQNFYQHWGVLEEVYAVKLDKGKVQFNKEETKLITNALVRLTELIKDKL